MNLYHNLPNIFALLLLAFISLPFLLYLHFSSFLILLISESSNHSFLILPSVFEPPTFINIA